MSDVLAEIERVESGGYREWLVVRRKPWGVSIDVDYQSPTGGRNTWHDAGVTVDAHELEALIAALSLVAKEGHAAMSSVKKYLRDKSFMCRGYLRESPGLHRDEKS